MIWQWLKLIRESSVIFNIWQQKDLGYSNISFLSGHFFFQAEWNKREHFGTSYGSFMDYTAASGSHFKELKAVLQRA